ncbi:phage portal protein family protein [Escherichia coli]|uniref:phage portal protein family protein n=1 Tax=Escherichia coli TaxID=562 RepID=UPI000E0590DE|nr:Mu prophage; Portal protein [Escherichia coli]
MISWGERSISKAILGGTLTTEAGDKGARSLGEVHNEVRREIRDSDLRQLAATLNRDLVYPLYALNTTHTIDIRRLPRICFQTKEPGDITKITSAVMQLSTGMDISDPWIRGRPVFRSPRPVKPYSVSVRVAMNRLRPTGKHHRKNRKKTEQTALSARLPEAKSTPRDELDDMGTRCLPAAYRRPSTRYWSRSLMPSERGGWRMRWQTCLPFIVKWMIPA